MEEIVDFEYLLRPIDEPVASPRIERFEIRSKRNAEYDKEEKYRNFMDYGPEFGEEKSPEPADWSAFIRECEAHLARKSKDLWVCAWYTEALLIRNGFPGLAAGLNLSKQMVERYWDQIEPNPQAEDGVEDTVKMFAGLNNGTTFIDRLMMTPITAAAGDHAPLTCATIDEVDGAIKAKMIACSDSAFQQALGIGIRDSIANFQELCETFKQKCGDDAPPAAKVREALGNCEKRILEIYPSLVALDETEEAVDSSETGLVENKSGSGGAMAGGGNHVQSREEAFKLLEQVSKFFRENEPSSPVSYALIQAVRWGRMSLPDLLNDLVEDGDVKSQIFKLTGIKGRVGEDADGLEEADES